MQSKKQNVRKLHVFKSFADHSRSHDLNIVRKDTRKTIAYLAELKLCYPHYPVKSNELDKISRFIAYSSPVIPL